MTTATASETGPHLDRQTFTTSRLLDYFSEKELTLQTGHGPDDWPQVALKELVDNALDAAETAGLSPAITVTVEDGALTVADNGPGLAPEVVERILDFATKTSSKDFYVSPTRGAQGNALKTLLAMPYVLSGGNSGRVEITSQGVQHSITVAVDRIRQEPVLRHDREPSTVKTGAIFTVRWPNLAGLEAPRLEAVFLPRIEAYSLLNPHASFAFCPAGKVHAQHAPTVPEAWRKWRPSDPTCPHWYSEDQLRALLAAYIAAEQNGNPGRFVRDFVSEFRGLSGSAKRKQVLEAAGLSGARLADLVSNGEVDRGRVEALLCAMQAVSREADARHLGVIGEAHIRERLAVAGCNANSIRYKRALGMDEDHRPYVVECAFGILDQNGDPEDEDSDPEDEDGDSADDDGESKGRRRLVCGLNFSPTIGNPFGNLGSVYDWKRESLVDVLGQQFASNDSPVLVLAHLTTPNLAYLDRGKTKVELPKSVGKAIRDGLVAVTKDWAATQRRMFRNQAAGERARQRMLRAYNRTRTIKDIVEEHMPAVYAKVSGDGTMPAGARQLMYAMRPIILAELPDKDSFSDQYFTQTLLPDYLQDHPEETASWDVVYDARGHFKEPHTGCEVALGTLAVREYLRTARPENCYASVLFIEKEGFLPLLESAEIAERYDLAIMSTKGMGSTAARKLMERLKGVRFLVLHDFDKSGFSIVGTLQRDTRRYQFENPPEVVDLGLRLADIEGMGLEGEPVTLRGENPEENLGENGATPEEIAYLTGKGPYRPQRVELNAMTSPQFIEFIEAKLKKHGVAKIVPPHAVLAIGYHRSVYECLREEALKKLEGELRKRADAITAPKTLDKQVRAKLKQFPSWRWTAAVSDIAAATHRAEKPSGERSRGGMTRGKARP